jgi:hypothetical protein
VVFLFPGVNQSGKPIHHHSPGVVNEPTLLHRNRSLHRHPVLY